MRLFRDRGGRNGKTVTVIRGLPERGAALEARVAEMKRLCGAGGTKGVGGSIVRKLGACGAGSREQEDGKKGKNSAHAPSIA